MEDKKSHPSLPSDYVTLAQLQQRWLERSNKKLQLQPQIDIQQNHPQQSPLPNQQPSLPNSTDSPKPHLLKNLKPHRLENRNQSPPTKVASDDRRKSSARVANENADLSSKVKKKTWRMKDSVKQKPKAEESRVKHKTKAEESGASCGAWAQHNEEGGEKSTIRNELNSKEEKNKKKNGNSVKVEKVEEKVRVLPMNTETVILSKINNGDHSKSQSRRNYFGHRRYGYRNGHGNGNKVERGGKMIWVKKDGT